MAEAVSLVAGGVMLHRISVAIDLPYDSIQAFCQQWKIVEFALFGSILTDQFRDDSDVDVLVTFADDAVVTLFDLVVMADELEALFERKVDIVTRRSVEQSDNYIRKRHILDSAQVIYVS